MENQQHQQQQDPPSEDDTQEPYLGRWRFDEIAQRMVFVVEESLPPIPTHVIPLPAPPSDCGSGIMSDSSLTISNYCPQSPAKTLSTNNSDCYSAHSHIIDSDNEDDEADDILDEETIQLFHKITTTKSVGTEGNKSVGVSVGSTANETAELSDIEGQRYPQSIFRKTRGGALSGKSKNSCIKKKVTLVAPEQS
mmetsp:Transcript_4136/g.9597  ORF Transcript_4136/g.9597 Transcript_4136/m.9597 type:complete len:194 (+) Transcript_4136:350-931(+)